MVVRNDAARPGNLEYLAGGGETGALIRAHAWAATPLGAPESWPQPLATLVGVMLASSQPMFVAWGDSRTLIYNDPYAEILGNKHPAAMGRDFLEVWHEIRGDLEGIVAKAYAGEPVHMDDIELWMERRGHPEETHFSFSYTPVRGNDGVVAGFFCACVEITGQVLADRRRRSAEAALRASEEFSRSILHASADCIKVLDLDARLEFMSTGGMCVMEVDNLDSVCGRAWPDFWQGEERDKALAAIEAARRGGSGRFQGFAPTMKGTPRWWDVAVKPINGADGQPERLLSVSRDITEQRTAEERLRELNETLEQEVAVRTAERDRMWDTSPDLMLVIDFRGYFQRVNPAWTALLGYQPHELVGHHVNEFVLPDDHAVTVDAYELAGSGGQPRIVNRYRHKDGSVRWISWVAAPAGGTTYATGRDITAQIERQAELEAAQEALRQSQKMEAMGQLTGGVAHDFNNLLTPIVGSLDLLQRKGLGGEREQRLIDGALQSAERAKTLVQRLLAFARRQPLQPTAVDIGRVVEGMTDLLRSTTGPQVRVVAEVAEGLPPARADLNQLEMALLNLGVNARDAMPSGGTLRISATSESLDTQRGDLKPGHYIRLSVADTGTGMDEATLARAVEPFFSTKGIGKGTGLGLSMAHGLAAQLSGTLTIRSRLGVGTNVELWLPVSNSPAQADEPPPQPAEPDGDKGVALLVDDEEIVRASTADMLADLGYRVAEAGSGEAALALLNGGLRPDLLVSDHLMPGMTGVELIRAAQGILPGLPVLIVSGYADTDGIEPDLQRLTKPFRRSDLAAKLIEVERETA